MVMTLTGADGEGKLAENLLAQYVNDLFTYSVAARTVFEYYLTI